jgi:hypothetical protein
MVIRPDNPWINSLFTPTKTVNGFHQNGTEIPTTIKIMG